MARKLRLQFPGAIYHVLSRGDRREPIFLDDQDRESFLQTLADACAKTGWHVHAFCLLPDHFHLVVETPHGNLVSGMKWFLGTYTARFNRRHQICGHVFSGRYKSSMIGPLGGYLRAVCDHVHLNPLRSGLVESINDLASYRWSSLPYYLAEHQRPPWLVPFSVFAECRIPVESATAGDQYLQQLRQRQQQDLEPESTSIRRSWCFGDDEFRQDLLTRMEGVSRESHFGSELQEASEAKAQRIIDEELRKIVWSHSELLRKRKGDPSKIAIAQRLRSETTVTLQWITDELHMGTKSHLSHLLYWRRRARAEAGKATVEMGGQVSSGERRPDRPQASKPRGEESRSQNALRRGDQIDRVAHAAKGKSDRTESMIPSTDPFEFDTRFD